MNFKHLIVPPDTRVKLRDFSTDPTEPYADRAEASEKLQADILKLSDLQARLAAQDTYALLVILQGMDAAGKDSTIKHVMSGVNPSGCLVKNFKAPSSEELDHDYLWRHAKALPERGIIGIFNRSYYEEVLVVRVHPELLEREKIPSDKNRDKLWAARFDEINQFESYLAANGIEVVKFYLHLSKKEQKKRFLARLDLPDKNWKFSDADVAERKFWDDYSEAYEDMLSHTSTSVAPWHVVPADHKWFTHLVVADVIIAKLASLDLHFPKINGQRKKSLENARKTLELEE
jgi:PPK2 family polyphosphate:nucleotide phosphotransferase